MASSHLYSDHGDIEAKGAEPMRPLLITKNSGGGSSGNEPKNRKATLRAALLLHLWVAANSRMVKANSSWLKA